MIYFTTIIFYLILLFGVGIYKSKKVKNQSDFAVAGRSLTPWILVGTMLATWIGTGSILGNAGKTYETGLAGLMLPIGGVLGIIILTQIAGKARDFEKFTIPEIIGDRFGNIPRMLSALALVIAYLVIVSYQYNAGGAVLETIFVDDAGNSMLSAQSAIIISAVFIIVYTMLAGLLSVAYTDVGNGIIITIAFVITFPILWIKAGGWSGIEMAFISMNKESHMQFWGVYSPLEIINFCLPPFLLILGDANMYQRFFASKNAKSAKKATVFLIFGVLIIELLIIGSAWVSSSMIPDADAGKFVMIISAYRFLPPILGAIMLTTIVGIIISTADSYLLVPATTIMRDFYQKYINPNASDKKIVLLSRILVLILGILAYLMSRGFAKSTTFFEKALYAYTIYGTAITPSLLAAFFWKRATSAGSIASILTGIIVTLLWKELPIITNSFLNELNEVIPAIILSVSALVIVSLFTGEKIHEKQLNKNL
ncbi:MAG: sodium:solute symporter family protein [Candidatus Marinimicrobia bacterium]|nr:sodium:solute symporter family protein [Candidatus Neomarinimicrobiota bacterium]